jgi:hypothetical protein
MTASVLAFLAGVALTLAIVFAVGRRIVRRSSRPGSRVPVRETIILTKEK